MYLSYNRKQKEDKITTIRKLLREIANIIPGKYSKET